MFEHHVDGQRSSSDFQGSEGREMQSKSLINQYHQRGRSTWPVKQPRSQPERTPVYSVPKIPKGRHQCPEMLAVAFIARGLAQENVFAAAALASGPILVRPL
jgi:hypothetical protein